MSERNGPPGWLEGLLLRRAGERDRPPWVVGDLREEYAALRRRRSAWIADAWYAVTVLRVSTRLGWEHWSSREGASGRSMLTSVLADIRHTFRQLVRSPGFALTAILTLALGIGANTAIFSAVNGLLLRPPAHVRDFDRLVTIYTSDYSGPPFGSSSLPDVEDFQTSAVASLAGVAAYTVVPVVIGGAAGTDAELILGQVVTGNYFDVLGVTMVRGRTFTMEEAERGGEGVAVLGNAFWQSRYGGDAAVLGRTIQLAGQSVTVVGIAPENFTGLLPGLVPAFYVSTGTAAEMGFVDTEHRGDRGMFVFGKLAPGATLEQARDQLAGVARALHERYPGEWTDVRDEPRRVTILPASEAVVPPQMSGPVTGFVAVLMAVVGAVLLISCANIANLLLARGTSRRREVGVRLAIGAGRGRLIRQMLTESMVLAGIGGALGVALAFGLTRLLATVELPLPVDVRLDVGPDARVLAFATVISVVAGLLFGLAPALLATGRSVVGALKEDAAASAGASGRKLGLRGVLAGGQIAVAVVLLVAGGLLVRSLQSAQSIDPGFRTSGMVFAALAQDDGASTPERRAIFQRELRSRLSAIPGVRSVSLAASLPLSANRSRRSFSIEDYRPGETEDMELHSTFVGPAYFETMGIPIVRGRGFIEADQTSGQQLAVVNEAFVDRYMSGQNPIGKRLALGGGSPLAIEIVGTTPTGKYVSLAEEPLPFVWLSAHPTNGFATVVIHAEGELAPIVEGVRRIVGELDASVAVMSVTTASEHLAYALLPQRIGAWLLGLFGALGLALSALGIYGVMAYAVSRRTREIGVRLALGARPADVVSMVVRQGMRVAVTGAVLGILIAFGVARLLSFLLFNTQPLDPITFLGVIALVLAVSFLANWLPARRTIRVDPLRALRQE
jgi:predicted permease